MAKRSMYVIASLALISLVIGALIVGVLMIGGRTFTEGQASGFGVMTGTLLIVALGAWFAVGEMD